ncbi:MAG TPA: hypothetical protein VFE45_17040 [Coriobacteriia bacterium]|nr:hypothetical protein [Coriobacteriia bacterium]
MDLALDTSFDFRTDAGGKDPDAHSPTLRRYHRLLWSKPLPGGAPFDLDVGSPGTYLHHRSALGEFCLSSDSVIPTFTWWTAMQPIIEQLTEAEIESFTAISYTVGGMVVFPSNRIDGKPTINGARGFNRKIADRFDLTLECIRRHYRTEDSPLGETLGRYRDFFALFEDFHGYVDFFLLQDLVDGDFSSVRFFLPFHDFTTPSVPRDVDAYREYRRLSIEFVEARNRRIDRLALDSE